MPLQSPAMASIRERAKKDDFLDTIERTVTAYVTTFLGLLLAVGFDLTDISAVKAAALASVPTALSVVKAAVSGPCSVTRVRSGGCPGAACDAPGVARRGARRGPFVMFEVSVGSACAGHG